MAAVTVNRYRNKVIGDRRAILATVTAAATGDTYASKLKLIDAVSAEPLQAGQPAVSVQVSGGTITFNYSGGGGATFTVMAVGT